VKFRFRSTKLEKCYRESLRAKKRWGEDVARTFIRRVEQIAACTTVQDFHLIPQFRFHALKGSRAGQHAIRLSDQMRLIVTFEEGTETVVWIEEVSKHYDD
jgi:proteic killer suppression protein